MTRHEVQSYLSLSAARASFSFGTVVSYAFWISAGLDIVLPEMTFVSGERSGREASGVASTPRLYLYLRHIIASI